MNFLERSQQSKEEMVRWRRYIHQHGEVAMDLPLTVSFVCQQLQDMGITPILVGKSGITATIGAGARTILLRADMDALPMKEESGLPFCTQTDGAHCCGHDMHTAMLLGAAKLLKEQELQLKGTVKLMFQPGEEIFQGADDMIQAGILESPDVNAAIGLHVMPLLPVGAVCCNTSGALMASCDGFRITIHGHGAHGSAPHTSIDPIHIGVQIYMAFQELIARETNPEETCVLTIGQFQAGTAANIIPETAVLQGTIRTFSQETRTFLTKRMKEVAQAIAAAFRGSVDIEITAAVPPLVCQPDLTKEMLNYVEDLHLPAYRYIDGTHSSGSEDFSLISQAVPSVYFFLGAAVENAPENVSNHNPKVRFHEDVLPIGAAIYAQCAFAYLEQHAKSEN